ncbi:MAG: SufD family Fe-S cluster assembly protein [Actinobacteria bacterium]|nr:SufD family Fe-S cluster assembly protein [Actinomycetota bacterium]
MTTTPATDHAPRISARSVLDHCVPTGREEEWRFAPLDRLAGLHASGELLPGTIDILVSGDGVDSQEVPPSDPRVASTLVPSDIVSARALASARQAHLVRIPRETVGSARIEIVGRGEQAGCHLVIEVAPFSSATVILDHSGSGALAENVEIRVGDSASLTLVSVQGWDRDAVHVGRHDAVLGRDARLVMGHVTLGGDVVRISPTVSYAQPGGDAELLGLFFAESGQFQEHRVFVDHAIPNCRSSVLYKGAVQGSGAHTVWIGDVLVRSGATGIDTYEVNRNLLLTDGARADSVPNLELETGEIVGAGHASAIGRFDDEQLFYLRARGIPEDLARVLVVRGFFADVLMRLGVPDVASTVMATVDSRLGVDLSGSGIEEDDD